jgi:hypothetical protein
MNTLAERISRYMPGLRKKPSIDKRQALAVMPVRNSVIGWDWKDDEVVLRVPLRMDRLSRIAKKVFRMRDLPEERQIALDEVGSVVWSLCDGQHDVNAIVGELSKRFKMNRREAEVSATMFFQSLAKRNLIGLFTAGGTKSGVKNKR